MTASEKRQQQNFPLPIINRELIYYYREHMNILALLERLIDIFEWAFDEQMMWCYDDENKI
jgi:hypothetical protein